MAQRYAKAVVVGASRGIGAEVARRLADAGAQVAIVARDAAALEALAAGRTDGRLRPYVHDVADRAAVPALFQRIAADLEGLDLVVYAAGAMPAVGSLEFDPAKSAAMLDVNLAGAVAWLDEAAARFAGVAAGAIVGIGSVAGDRGRRMNPAYHASKAGLAAYLESLRNRLAGRGVVVTTIKPGPVDTAMTAGYKGKKMPLATAADLIFRRLGAGREVYLSPVHRMVFAAIRLLPTGLMRRLPV